jgi:56kDa selenium binding protein (SBP56)
MSLLRPDPTFDPSPRMAMHSPPEKLGYLALINPKRSGAHDAIAVVDDSKSYGRLVGQTDMPHEGDELHHFGWNACSSCLCPYSPHPHMERRYLIVPGISSSRIHILDTKSAPRQPKIVRVIEPEEVAARSGYSAPHTVHCGPEGVYLSWGIRYLRVDTSNWIGGYSFPSDRFNRRAGATRRSTSRRRRTRCAALASIPGCSTVKTRRAGRVLPVGATRESSDRRGRPAPTGGGCRASSSWRAASSA